MKSVGPKTSRYWDWEQHYCEIFGITDAIIVSTLKLRCSYQPSARQPLHRRHWRSKMMKTCDVLRFLCETNFNMAKVSHKNCAVNGKKNICKNMFLISRAIHLWRTLISSYIQTVNFIDYEVNFIQRPSLKCSKRDSRHERLFSHPWYYY